MKKALWLPVALFVVAWIGPAPQAKADGPFQVRTVSPCRAVDTRPGSPLSGGEVRSFPIIGVCGIPSTAKAAFMNVAAIGPTGSGFIRLWAAGTPMPLTSTVNFDGGETAIADGALVELSQGPNSISLLFQAGAIYQGHVIIDVVAYLE